MSDQLLLLAHYEDPQLATRHAGHLRAAGVPCVLETVMSGDFYFLDTPVQAGDALLKVAPEHAARAHALLDQLDVLDPAPSTSLAHTYLFLGGLMVFTGLITSLGSYPEGGGHLQLVPFGLAILGLLLGAKGWLLNRS